MKILINTCYGGWGLSNEAILRFSEKRPEICVDELYDIQHGYVSPHDRTDPDLISIVEELGEKANSAYSKIKIMDIPDEATDWDISEFDGKELLYYVVGGKIHTAY